MELKIDTVLGEVTIKDVMVDVDGTNLREGVDMFIGDELICELTGYCAETFEDDAELVEELINIYAV